MWCESGGKRDAERTAQKEKESEMSSERDLIKLKRICESLTWSETNSCGTLSSTSQSSSSPYEGGGRRDFFLKKRASLRGGTTAHDEDRRTRFFLRHVPEKIHRAGQPLAHVHGFIAN